MFVKKILSFVFMLLSLGVFAGASAEQSNNDNKIKLIASTSIITDVVSRIGEDKIELYGLMKQGQDPHSYTPTPRDMSRIESADLIFTNGFGLEENLLSLIESVGTDNLIEVSAGIIPPESEGDEHHEDAEDHYGEDEHETDSVEHHHDVDPHTWMSPLNVMIWTDNISAALVAADPKNKDFYENNAAEYKKELWTLHEDIKSLLSDIPEKKRIIVSDHQIFSYYVRDYGFHSGPSLISGYSSGAEISSRNFAELSHYLEENQIPAIFIGSNAGEKVKSLSEAIRNETGHPIEVISILTGTLANKGERGDNYIDFIRYNSELIHKGLGK